MLIIVTDSNFKFIFSDIFSTGTKSQLNSWLLLLAVYLVTFRQFCGIRNCTQAKMITQSFFLLLEVKLVIPNFKLNSLIIKKGWAEERKRNTSRYNRVFSLPILQLLQKWAQWAIRYHGDARLEQSRLSFNRSPCISAWQKYITWMSICSYGTLAGSYSQVVFFLMNEGHGGHHC